jgi:hypothetical protein
MIETSPQLSESPAPAHDNEHEAHKSSGSSFGLRAACLIFGLTSLVLAYIVYQENSTVSDTRTQLAQATDEGTQIKSDLDKANSKVSDMQSRLTAATAKSGDLEAQLAKAQGQNSDLQAQIGKANGQISGLKAQLVTAKDSLSEAQAQVSQANDGSALLLKQLDASKAQVADLQTQLAKTELHGDASASPAAAPLAAMPIAATFEKSFWSGDYTLHIRNTNTDPLVVTIAVASPKGPAPFTATIKGGSIYDVGKLASGANVVVTSNGFSPVNLTVH